MGRAGHQPAFAVGYGDGMHVACPDLAQPGRQIGNDSGLHHPGHVPANPVECQSRAVGGQWPDLPIRQQAQFDQGLEAVADSQDQSVALLQQPGNRVRQRRIVEQRRNELARSLRFVPGAETAREHQYLRLIDRPDNGPDRFLDILGRQIPDDERLDAATRFFKGQRRIILAVGTGKNRNKHAGTRH